MDPAGSGFVCIWGPSCLAEGCCSPTLVGESTDEDWGRGVGRMMTTDVEEGGGWMGESLKKRDFLKGDCGEGSVCEGGAL